jgi:hypothetical protein
VREDLLQIYRVAFYFDRRAAKPCVTSSSVDSPTETSRSRRSKTMFERRWQAPTRQRWRKPRAPSSASRLTTGLPTSWSPWAKTFVLRAAQDGCRVPLDLMEAR